METIRTLFWADRIAFRRWFETGTTSRLIVASLFFVMFGAISAGLFIIGGAFFRSLASFESYGLLTAGYIVHAAVVIILWLAVGSSVTASAGLLLTPGRDTSLLLTLPVPGRRIVLWIFTKTLIMNHLLILFAFAPIMLSFAMAFHLLSVGFIIRTLLIFHCLVLIASSVGMTVAILFAGRLKGKEYPAGILGILLFFTGMLALIKLIFPPALSQLYSATAESFNLLFPALPLNNPLLPTAWLSNTVTSGFSVFTLMGIALTGAIVLLSLAFQFAEFIPSLIAVQSAKNSGNISPFAGNRLVSFRYPLVIKDLLAVIRLPSETGYGLFLGSIALFFFLFVSAGTTGGFRQDIWKTQLSVFSFGWLLFFTIAYGLRFMYPLMGRDGVNAWHVFTSPVSRKKLLQSKVIATLLFSVPPLLFAILIWRILPFAAGFRTFLTTAGVLVILTVSLSQTFLGAILPDFSRDATPEKSSTSGMGLVTLGLTVGIAFITGWIIEQVLRGYQSPLPALAMIAVPSAAFTMLLWYVVRDAARRYEW